MRKRIFLLFLSFSLYLTYFMAYFMLQPVKVFATPVSELKEQKALNEQKLNEVNQEISSLSQESKGITEEIEEIDDQLVEVIASVSLLEDDIEEVEKQIEVTKAEYEEAKQKEENQYAAMKKRIQYMYEKGEASYLSLLLGADELSDVVNRAEYIEKLYEYDDKVLKEYIEAKQAVEAKKTELEEEQSELEANMYELEEEKKALDELLAEKKAQQEDFENRLAKAKQEAAAYKAKIKQQNSQIRKLEEEEKARLAAQAKKNNSSGSIDSAGIISGANGSAGGKEIASYACKFVGNPYVAGGTSLTNGADCSGFTYAVYQAFGYSIPRTSTAQRSAGRGVTYAEAEPGDIICYAGHVAIYLGGGRIVHASTPATGIKYGTATYKEIVAVRRIVN